MVFTWGDVWVWTAHHLVVSEPVRINGTQYSKCWHSVSTVEYVVDDSFKVVPEENTAIELPLNDIWILGKMYVSNLLKWEVKMLFDHNDYPFSPEFGLKSYHWKSKSQSISIIYTHV